METSNRKLKTPSRVRLAFSDKDINLFSGPSHLTPTTNRPSGSVSEVLIRDSDQDQDPGSPLKLNYDYRNRNGESFFDYSILSTTSSASSASEDIDSPRSFNMQHFIQHIRDQRADFRKFLPVPLSSIDMPVLKVGEKDKKEYREAQEAFLGGSRLCTSRSDTSLSESPEKKKGSHHKGNKFLKMLNCKKSEPLSPKVGKEHKYQTISGNDMSSSSKQLPKPSSLRFDFETNDSHCKLVAFSEFDKEEFSISVYVELTKEPNHYLCHVQTELAVAAVKSYFGSLEEQASIELLWVGNIQKTIAYLLTTDLKTKFGDIKTKFGDLRYLKRAECIMVISPKACALLRHCKLAFLHSLGAILQTNPRKTLILVKGEKKWTPTIPKMEAEKPKRHNFLSFLFGR